MSKREKKQTTDVFTPTTPARLTFVERETINKKLVNAIKTPGKQIIVYGHSGSGKTTLLENKLFQTYEAHITTRCVKGLSFEQLVLDAFDQLGGFYESERVSTTKSKISSSLTAEYAGIKAQIGSELAAEDQRKQQRILPPQLTPQTLARLLGEANCCWVLEDFHKVESDEKVKLAQVMKVFMDMADKYRDLKIIAIGAVNTARQVVESDSEMKGRVAEIVVPLMQEIEMEQIIKKGEDILNLRLTNNVRQDIVRYSNGLPAVSHQLCLNMCFSAGIYETMDTRVTIDKDVLSSALEEYIEAATDTMKSAFDRALRRRGKGKYDHVRLTLSALVTHDQAGATQRELYQEIQRTAPAYPSAKLAYYLKGLQSEERGALLRKDPASGRYSFADPIYRAMALAMFTPATTPPQAGPSAAHLRDRTFVSTPFAEGAWIEPEGNRLALLIRTRLKASIEHDDRWGDFMEMIESARYGR